MISLRETAQAIVSPGRGMLALDDRRGPIQDTMPARYPPAPADTLIRRWLEVLLASDRVCNSISAISLDAPIFNQLTSAEIGLPEVAQGRGILLGVRADTGRAPAPGLLDEQLTEGFDGLASRLSRFARAGARFACFRVASAITPQRPTRRWIRAHCLSLARFAADCQAQNLVPVLEFAIDPEGSHTLGHGASVVREFLHELIGELAAWEVELGAALLKLPMARAGEGCPEQPGSDQAAELTLAALRDALPPNLCGVVFSCQGWSPMGAVEALEAINGHGRQPWELSYCFSHALQDEALAAWLDDENRVAQAQDILAERARRCAQARTPTMISGSGVIAA
jgi:fructose-bisphosphate aldolase class I